MESWIQYIRSVQIDSLVKIMYSPIWGNTQINENGNYIVNEWYNKGIRNAMDLTNENGLIYEFQELKQRYDIPGTYLNYIRLMKQNLFSKIKQNTFLLAYKYKSIKYREGGEI